MSVSPLPPPGDRAAHQAFTEATEPHRRELRVHCYRMTGSLEESEDLLQETLLRAWRGWSGFRGSASVRTWLYRIATNVCLDHLSRRERRVLPYDVTAPADGTTSLPPPSPRPWLEPIPDSYLAPLADPDPQQQVVHRETVELAFLAAIQALPPRQRAALVLRDVLGLPAGEVAGILATSVAAVKSALQRARATMRRRLPPDRAQWPARTTATAQEREVLRRYVAALAERDAAAMAALLDQDLRVAFPPRDLWVRGRDTFIEGSRRYAPAGEFRYLEAGANYQPAVAVYLRPPGEQRFRLLSLAVLRVVGTRIVEIIDFGDPAVLARCGQPSLLA